MSAGAQTVTIPPRFERAVLRATAASDTRARPWIRLATFAALALYGVQRWGTMLRPAPTWRLVGVVALAVALAGVVPPLRRFNGVLSAVVSFGLVVAALPMAGLRWHLVTHVRIAVSADRIGDGLQALPNVLVPYLGHNHAVRLVIVLGAAVLLLDGAAVMAFAPRAFGDARRAAAALPLIALAIVPSTLVRPELAYLQGLLLFALLAAFMWGERVGYDSVTSAFAIAALAGVGGAVLAPRIDQRSPWVNYRAWTGTVAHQHVDTFNWNQTYGPLRWPRAGHEVLTVQARNRDYWKAEDLDTFNGHAWVTGPQTTIQPPPPSVPSPAVAARWRQVVRVTIQGMQTTDVIAAGFAGEPTPLPGGVGQGADPGTWVAGRELGPGTTYELTSYSPHPSPTELSHTGRDYPDATLTGDLTLSIPVSGVQPASFPEVTFGPFHSGRAPVVSGGDTRPEVGRLVTDSPYGGAYALARQLAVRARTPYQFVASVERYLGRGYIYNQDPPRRAYPLESFLFKDKEGYCQQFSGAMALLLRMGGVPARVASGFTSGTYDTATHQWVVSDIDAHAWIEAWFPRYGWVRFDPTPASAPARGGTGLPTLLKTVGISKPESDPSHGLGASSAPGIVASRESAGGTSPVLIVGLLALAAALGALLRGWLRSGRSPDDLLAELERALARTRRPLKDGVTLASLEHRFRSSPEAAGYVRSLRLARYGGHSAPPSAAQRRALRHELRIGLGLIGGVRSLWALPPRLRLTTRRRSRRLK